ncbi:unnamed protein product, partial [Candidula unifasciata]
RNVALKENATQSSTHNFRDIRNSADKAVDGNTDQNFGRSSCTHTAIYVNKDGHIPTWTLRFSRQRSVHRYVIYNRADNCIRRIMGFKLESFDALNRSVFVYRDSSPNPKSIYTISHQPLDIGMIVVSITNSDLVLTLCEVEVYGDSVCDAWHYARDCELECYCPYGDACFVGTGWCPNCPAGFFGLRCLS